MRPCKPRRIGVLPSCRRYGPQGGVPEGENRIGLDMLEALRLVDAEGMPQEQVCELTGLTDEQVGKLL